MQTPNTPRPKRDSESVIKAAAEKLFPAVAEWLRAGGDEQDDREEVIRRLKAAIAYCSDGYEIAKRLDNIGWSPDAGLVEILDNAYTHKSKAHSVAVEEWIKTSGLVAYPVGTWVRCNEGHPTDHPGHVVSNDEKEGKSTVCVPALGHSPEPGPKGGTIGIVVVWENLTPTEEGGAK